MTFQLYGIMNYWTALINFYNASPSSSPSRAKTLRDYTLTTKSQLLSSNSVIASAMLSIPVHACENKKAGKFVT